MARVESISPEQARSLLADGHRYVDVRSEAEFAGGHPAGAYSIPLMHAQSGRLIDNPDFVAVVAATFAKDAPLVVGCQAGGRSLRAVQMLLAAGFENVVNMEGGWGGGRDAFGRRVAGWQELGFDTETAADPGRTYAVLAVQAAGAQG